MPRIIKVDEKTTIRHLYQQGWSLRRISRELGLNRRTVSKYAFEDDTSKCTISNTGNEAGKERAEKGVSYGRKSNCAEFETTIREKYQQGLHGQRIYQDLVADHGYKGSAQSVRRLLRKLKKNTDLPHRVMHSLPGEEAQIDFGQGAPILLPNGRKKRPHLFRIVLSHSRKAYSEVVESQCTELFIRAIENAFRHFGGVPKTLVPDNLKAAVIRADWYDPELNPKLRSFAEHYGTVILPTKPRTPEHKGKVENGIKYCQDNALKGREFSSLQAQNLYLRDWEQNIADKRIHGTTQLQVQKAFEDGEKNALQPLPPSLFPCFDEGERKVQRNGHVEIIRSFYSVPPEYLGHQVWVRFDLRTVRVFNQRMQQIAMHARLPRGQYSTQREHIASEKINSGEYGSGYLLMKLREVDLECAAWGEMMLENRGIEGIRLLQGILSLRKKYSKEQIRKASIQAMIEECWHMKDFRRILESEHFQPELDYADSHSCIRPISEYSICSDAIFDQTKEGELHA